MMLGAFVIRVSKAFWQFLQLMFTAIDEIFRPPVRVKEFIKQLEFIANQSVIIIVVCVCFAAMVTILESSYHMKLVIQNDSLVPGFAAMLILRELGVVVTALLLTSRVGAGIAAEVGTMKITEQIEALEMLGIRPIQYLVVPRLLAGILGTVILTIIANIVCIAVAMIVSNLYLGFTLGMFVSSMHRFVGQVDFVTAITKGAVFGMIIPLVGCYYGFKCELGAEGVGRATTMSVVTSSVAIIVFDFLLSYAFSAFV